LAGRRSAISLAVVRQSRHVGVVLNSKQLAYFVRIAELGSFRRASEELRIAQPALTRQILKLEQELGVELLNRGGRAIALTSAGSVLLDRAKFILRQTEQARLDVIAEGTTPSGVIGIGAPASIAQVLFGPLAKRYIEQYPQVSVRFYEGVGLLRKWLQTGEIDLAIIPESSLAPGGNLEFRKFISERVYLVGPPGSLKDDSACSASDVIGKQLILTPPPSTVHGWLGRVAAEGNQSLKIVAETESMQIQKDLVRANLGFAVLPYSAIYPDAQKGLYSVSRVRGWRLGRTLAWRVDRPLTPAAAEMVRMISIEMQQLAKQGVFGPSG
jgi:LysR family transcriptional regulator, nitrogen assimilation regulatory protein